MKIKYIASDGRQFDSKSECINYEKNKEEHHLRYKSFVYRLFGIEIDEYEIYKNWPYTNVETKKLKHEISTLPVYRMEIPITPAEQEPEYYNDPDEVVYVMCEYPYLAEPFVLINNDLPVLFSDVRFLYPFKKEDVEKVNYLSKSPLKLTEEEMNCIDFWGGKELEDACKEENKFAIPIKSLEKVDTFPTTDSLFLDFEIVVTQFLHKHFHLDKRKNIQACLEELQNRR